MALSQYGETIPTGPGDTSTSRRMHEEARRWSPQGVHGEGKHYEPYPHVWRRAVGARMWDVDGNEYVDYWCAAGPVILGHNHPAANDAAKRALDEIGVLFCAPYPGEMELAKLIRRYVLAAEMSGFGCGGSDAIVYALRAARSYTGRTKILRCEGSYHGWYDGVLFSVAPKPEQIVEGEYTAVPESTGLPPEAREHVVVCAYNDADQMERLVEQHKDELAAIIIEPISHSMGVVLPVPGFLERARQLCDAYGIVLIFDEIITGFRHGLGGAQGLLGVTPDLSAFGKAMANGYPICAVSGKQRFMQELAPHGRAFFSGTFNGNPLCVEAARATIRALDEGRVHDRVFRLGRMVADGINALARRHGVRVQCVQVGSTWCVYVADRAPQSYREILRHHDAEAGRAFVHHMWRRGFYTTPRRAAKWYINGAHTEEDIKRTIDAAGAFFAEHAASLR
ncbi:MAG: aspartate aminotransferase family protein [Chloroflexi bacterium]|nr:aspartate aminotransferase family protein [Chloroflexota bacterium]